MRARGFTLIELIIVMGIIGILAIVAVPNFLKFQERAEEAKAARIAEDTDELIIPNLSSHSSNAIDERIHMIDPQATLGMVVENDDGTITIMPEHLMFSGKEKLKDKDKSWALRKGGGLLCGLCAKEGKKSQVYPGMCFSTLMACYDYYDKDGNLHGGDCNTTTCEYRCSEGHWFSEAF